MAVVTIFGGTFGNDEDLARSVAKALDCRFVSREIFVDAARRCEVPEAKLNDILEKEPHWWERWLENLRPYRIALQAAMSEAALSENLVYLGHVSHGLLPGIRHVIRVLLTAPVEYQIEQVRARQGLEPGAARHFIEHVNKARTRRLMALFGTDWRDPGQYALVVNMGQVSVAGAEKIITRAALLDEYQVTAASRLALASLALSSKVQAALLNYPRFRDLNISVVADQGNVTLTGIIPVSVSEEDLRHVIEMIPGVTKVITDLVHLPSRAVGYV
ncbi:MAG: cytidylate kinase family protein [Deltaproteobacteria bacterium]|nr:cytidylate kinase family protein [Deltaproteobacteria bacterium]